MKRLLLLLLPVFLLLSHPLWSEPINPKHLVDVDGDGIKEWVCLDTFERDGVVYGQMILLDGRGDVLWAGSKNVPEFLFLGDYDGGNLEAAYQTKDGQTFVLASYQKSDVRPTRFRLFTWHNRGFVHLRDGQLLPSGKKAGHYTWRDNPAAQRWLERFEGVDEYGRLKAQITDLSERSQESVVLRPDGRDFVQD